MYCDHWVGGPVAFPRDSVLGVEEKKNRKDRREREGAKRKKKKIEKKETHPSVFLIRHPTQGRYRLRRSPALASQSNFA